MMISVSFKSLLLAGLTCVSLTGAAPAQNLFSAVVKVNDRVVTEYEVQQRQLFLRTLNAPGGGRDAVIEALIEDRLRMGAAQAAGLALTDEGTQAALAEFAARANMDTDSFVQALQDSGVSRETFRDYVVNGTLWREVVRARYGNLVQISEAEIDRALAAATAGSGLRVLVSEIILPLQQGNEQAAAQLAEDIAQITDQALFSQYAQRYSAAPSRGNGGRLDWQDISKLPASLRPILLGLAPGDVTDPLTIPGALALFQLRDITEVAGQSGQAADAALDYAVYSLANPARADQLRQSVDTCDDLYGAALGNPGETLLRQTTAPGEISNDIRGKLADLDADESVIMPRDDGVVLVMLCGRTALINQDTSREDMANSLRGARLEGYAATLLEQLRADARILWQ